MLLVGGVRVRQSSLVIPAALYLPVVLRPLVAAVVMTGAKEEVT